MERSLFYLPTWQNALRKAKPGVPVSVDPFDNYYHPPVRCGHTSICVNNDLIIWGGYNEPQFGDQTYRDTSVLWVYNIDGDLWFMVQTTGQSPLFRSGAVSSLIWPIWYISAGHVIVGDKNDIYGINLLTLEWQHCEPSTKARMSCRDKSASFSWKDRIYLFGGFGPNPPMNDPDNLWDPERDIYAIEPQDHRGWNNQLVYFDTTTKEWIRPAVKGPIPPARAAHSLTRVSNIVYLFGGRHRKSRLNDLHRLDLESDTWSGSLICNGESPIGRSWHTMSHIGGKYLLLFGGYDIKRNPLEDAWLLNIETLSWSVLVKKTGFPRLWHTASVNSSGDVMVFGGCSTDILKSTNPMITHDNVILFRISPFSLQRLCLHSLYRNTNRTLRLWHELPEPLYNTLRNRLFMRRKKRTDIIRHNIDLGFGPSLSHLSVMSKEDAEFMNENNKKAPTVYHYRR